MSVGVICDNEVSVAVEFSVLRALFVVGVVVKVGAVLIPFFLSLA